MEEMSGLPAGPTYPRATSTVLLEALCSIGAPPWKPRLEIVRTTSDHGRIEMKDTFDGIVIGSGAGGSPIANRLVRNGKSVLVLDKGPLLRTSHQVPSG